MATINKQAVVKIKAMPDTVLTVTIRYTRRFRLRLWLTVLVIKALRCVAPFAVRIEVNPLDSTGCR